MVQRRLDEAVRAMQGELISGEAAAVWSGVRLDSRSVTGGELFFALAGERTDGHRFVTDALEAGAAAAIIDRRQAVPATGALVLVDETLDALHRLTRAIRTRVPQRLVAITGSSGKTTTKEMLAAMLASRYRTAGSPGNLNNLYGFPVALLGIPDDTEWMVAEMGMSTPDELRQVSLLGRPDVAVFTNVREAHLESFGSIEAIASAKAELLEGLADDGIVVANADDPLVRRIAAQHDGRVVWYGHDEGDVTAADVRPAPNGAVGWRLSLRAGGERVTVELPLFGRYNVDNYLAAAACAHTLGVSLAEIGESPARYQALPNRGVVHRLTHDVTLVDDSYNSNPDALVGALESAAQLSGARHWAVLGEMLELGSAGAELHRKAGRRAAQLGFDPVVGVGDLARDLVEAASEAGASTRWFESAEAAVLFVGRHLDPGDVLLVKGSRGVELDRLVAHLLLVEES